MLKNLNESDSRELSTCILKNSSSSLNWRICPIIRSIRSLCSASDVIYWEWISREANRAAHAAASLAIGAVGVNGGYPATTIPDSCLEE